MAEAASYQYNTARLNGSEAQQIFDAIAVMHRERLKAGALAQMPVSFLSAFYRHLASREDCFVAFSHEGTRCYGFVAGSVRSSALLASFVRSSPTAVMGSALMLLSRPSLLVRIISIALHLSHRPKHGSAVSDCQLLSIAVVQDIGRAGLGTALYAALTDWFGKVGSSVFDIVASQTQQPAIAFYRKRGARVIGRFDLGGLESLHLRSAPIETRNTTPDRVP